MPKLKKWTAILAKLREIFRRNKSQPVGRVIELINPILRGWVNYFAVGHSGRCFTFIEDWVEKKIRRHMMRAKKRKGFGWKRWSREWLHEVLGLFCDYRVRYYAPSPTIRLFSSFMSTLSFPISSRNRLVTAATRQSCRG